MELFHWRENARGVANKYRKQYANCSPDYLFPHGHTVAENQALLDQLDPETASLDDYGHMRQWVAETCDECGQQCEALVHFGDEPDYDARWSRVCGGCLTSGLALLPTPTRHGVE